MRRRGRRRRANLWEKRERRQRIVGKNGCVNTDRLTWRKRSPQDHERPTLARFHVPLQDGHSLPVLHFPPRHLLASSLGYHVHESRGLATRIQRGEFFSILHRCNLDTVPRHRAYTDHRGVSRTSETRIENVLGDERDTHAPLRPARNWLPALPSANFTRIRTKVESKHCVSALLLFTLFGPYCVDRNCYARKGFRSLLVSMNTSMTVIFILFSRKIEPFFIDHNSIEVIWNFGIVINR